MPPEKFISGGIDCSSKKYVGARLFFIGALYVLNGNVYLRISIRGLHEKEEKKCLALANMVLKHLSTRAARR